MIDLSYLESEPFNQKLSKWKLQTGKNKTWKGYGKSFASSAIDYSCFNYYDFNPFNLRQYFLGFVGVFFDSKASLLPWPPNPVFFLQRIKSDLMICGFADHFIIKPKIMDFIQRNRELDINRYPFGYGCLHFLAENAF